MSSFDIPGVPAEAMARARRLIDSGERRLLGIAAPPGAGKSTLAEALARSLVEACGPVVQVVPMDGFHLANEELARLGRAGRKGAADTFDAWGYANLLRRLRAQPVHPLHPSQPQSETVYAPRYERSIEASLAGSIAIEPSTRLVITEGNYLLLDQSPWTVVAGLLDDCRYLDVPEPLRHAQLLARHQRFGRSREEAERWMAQTDEPNARKIEATRSRASYWLRWD